MKQRSGKMTGRCGLCRIGVMLLVMAGLGSSCTTPPSRDGGLVGILYHAAVRPDVAGLADRQEPARQRGESAEVSRVDVGRDRVTPPIELDPPRPPAYRLSPGDVLTVSYFASPFVDGEQYLVENQDVLTISIVGQDTYTDSVMVRPDGCISFYLIGEMHVRGQSIAQIREELARRIEKIMPAAEVTVILKEANVSAQRFLDTLRSNTDLGATRIIRVRPDGTVTFPLIGEFVVMGRTLNGLTEEVERRYADVFRGGLSLALNLNSSSEGNIAVLGEVRSPGRYTVVRPVSVFFALAMAGGTLDTAKKSQVIVVKNTDRHVNWYVVNMDLESGHPLGPDIPLGPQDMLLVPKSGVADLNRFVDQYIRRLLPIPVGAGVGFNYDLND